ncbi:hypothetical protein W02_07930 [Nitrospira sp. KM1]|nr:hypothetical protein W02_07930 [Nitrospira sp. KM1]
MGKLDGFLNPPAAKAARADLDALGRTIDDCPNTLQIWIERPFRLVVGMADVVASLMFLRTNITCKCHGRLPCVEVDVRMNKISQQIRL